MSKIKILSPELISKIAAGEVIERPSSVIKELVENSLDAGSTAIDVEIKKAGKISIVVKDNGCGIEKNDLDVIFSRHATSKISSIDDLFAINSLGFRGEALYSIAAVSDVVLRSRVAASDTGWEIHLRGQEKISLKPVSMPRGTEIEIKELFFNTPARKKFLKTDTTELNQILNLFLPYTLLHPDKKFSLTHYDKTILNLEPDTDFINRCCKALNLDHQYLLFSQKDFPQENIKVQLVLGDVNIQRGRKDLQFIFINNRPVSNRAISFHLNQVYKLIMPQDAYPFFCLYLTIPAYDLDVNIHPTKREVKIKDEQSLASLLRFMAEELLMQYAKAKQLHEFSLNIQPSQENQVSEPVSDYLPSPDFNQETSSLFNRTAADDSLEIPRQSSLSGKLTSSLYLGQFLNKYLFFETPSSLLVIDQHAAQERVTYEQFKHQIETNTIEVQNLLMPEIIALVPQELVAWDIVKDKLQELGFSTTLWSNQSIALHTHPILIKKPDIAVRSLLNGESINRCDADDLARRACRNSLMAGYKMSSQQAEFLRTNLLKCFSPFSCPHGRPTVIEIPEKTFEREFLR